MPREIKIIKPEGRLSLIGAAIAAVALKRTDGNVRVLFGENDHAIPVTLQDEPDSLIQRWQDAQALITARSAPTMPLADNPEALSGHEALERTGLNL